MRASPSRLIEADTFGTACSVIPIVRMSAMTVADLPAAVPSSIRSSMMPLSDDDFDLTEEEMLNTFAADQNGSALVPDMTEQYRRMMPGHFHKEVASGRHVSKHGMSPYGDRLEVVTPSWPVPNLIPLYPPPPSTEASDSYFNWNGDLECGNVGDDALFGGTNVDSLLGNFSGEARETAENVFSFSDFEGLHPGLPYRQPEPLIALPQVHVSLKQSHDRQASTSPPSSHGPRGDKGGAQVPDLVLTSHSGSGSGCSLAGSPTPLDTETPLSDGMDMSAWADYAPQTIYGRPDTWMNSIPSDSPLSADLPGDEKTLVRFRSENSVSLRPAKGYENEDKHEDCGCVECQTSRLLRSGSSEGSYESGGMPKSASDSGSLDTRSSGKVITVADGASRPLDMSARLAALVGNLVPPEPFSARTVLQSSLSTSTTRPLPPNHKSRPLALRAGKEGKIKAGTEASQKKMRAPRVRRLVALDGTVRPSSVMIPSSAPCPSMDLMLARGAVGAMQRDVRPEQLGVQLVAYAEAMATDDQAKVRFLHGMLQRHADPCGLPMQKTVHYFMQALHARAEGTGSQRYNEPFRGAREEMLEGFGKCSGAMPYLPFCHEVLLTQILDASRSATRLHIVDINSWHANLWCTLLWKLSKRPGGPPTVRLTLLQAPWLANPIKGACRPKGSDVRRELEGRAAALGVEFEYEAVEVGGLERLRPGQVRRTAGEVLVVCAAMTLNTLFDATVVRANPRDSFLQVLRQLRPNLFLLLEHDVDTNGLFFMERFKEILRFWLTSFDSQHQSKAPVRTREIFEREYIGRDILNVVACEGLERTVRAERLGNWRKRLERVGFAEVEFGRNVFAAADKVVKGFSPHFSCAQDGGAAKMMWQKSAMIAASGWTTMF